MDPYVVWMLIGIVLIIVELTTGTLYLLFLGVSALAAALAGYLGYGFGAQVGAFAAVAAVTLAWVQWRRRSRADAAGLGSLEIGHSVQFESWVDPAQGTARVRYRGTLWNAVITGQCRGHRGEILYIKAVDGGTLTLAKVG